jgi:curved DNA-binding protein CbpA
MTSNTYHFEVLQLTKTCFEVEIKKAFRELGLRWHPNKNKTCREAATQKFKEVCEAYEILGDTDKKSAYERYGMNGILFGFKHKKPETIFQAFYEQFGGWDIVSNYISAGEHADVETPQWRSVLQSIEDVQGFTRMFGGDRETQFNLWGPHTLHSSKPQIADPAPVNAKSSMMATWRGDPLNGSMKSSGGPYSELNASSAAWDLNSSLNSSLPPTGSGIKEAMMANFRQRNQNPSESYKMRANSMTLHRAANDFRESLSSGGIGSKEDYLGRSTPTKDLKLSRPTTYELLASAGAPTHSVKEQMMGQFRGGPPSEPPSRPNVHVLAADFNRSLIIGGSAGSGKMAFDG